MRNNIEDAYLRNVRIGGPRTVLEAPMITSYTGAAAPVSIATAGNVTYTAAQLLSGTIVRDPAGASRVDTLPTAALMAAAIPGIQIGDTVECQIVNGADAAETITITEGSGGAYDVNQTAASRVIPQNASRTVRLRFTNVTTPAYTVYLA